MLKFRNKKNGYTLAEMLMVLVIFALMMIALPPLTKKMFKVDTVAKAHGRLECYYNKDGKLIQYRISEKSQPTYEDRTSIGYCEFIPPSNSLYTMIHAVGGGGAGYSLNTGLSAEKISYTTVEAFSYLYYSNVSLWPEWFKYIMDNKQGLTFNGDNFETKKTFKQVSLPYGQSGEPGERISMFYPRLKGVTIRLTPGKGGAVTTSSGGNGGDTTVEFIYSEGSSSSLVAKGGRGGSVLGKYGAALTGGDATDYGISELTSVKSRTSGFENIIEDPGIEDNHETRINIRTGSIKGQAADWGDINAGWGGNGGYHYVSKSLGDDYTGRFSYQINNYDEVYTSTGDTERNDKWKLLTSYINPNFYKRSGQKANCSLEDKTSGVKVRAWCNNYRSDPAYKYKCHINDKNSVINPGSSTTYSDKEVIIKTVDNTPRTVPTGYSSCSVDEVRNNVECTISGQVPHAYHNCPFTQDYTEYTCLGATAADDKKSGNNTCKAGNGGNGAVIILW